MISTIFYCNFKLKSQIVNSYLIVFTIYLIISTFYLTGFYFYLIFTII